MQRGNARGNSLKMQQLRASDRFYGLCHQHITRNSHTLINGCQSHVCFSGCFQPKPNGAMQCTVHDGCLSVQLLVYKDDSDIYVDLHATAPTSKLLTLIITTCSDSFPSFEPERNQLYASPMYNASSRPALLIS